MARGLSCFVLAVLTIDKTFTLNNFLVNNDSFVTYFQWNARTTETESSQNLRTASPNQTLFHFVITSRSKSYLLRVGQTLKLFGTDCTAVLFTLIKTVKPYLK